MARGERARRGAVTTRDEPLLLLVLVLDLAGVDPRFRGSRRPPRSRPPRGGRRRRAARGSTSDPGRRSAGERRNLPWIGWPKLDSSRGRYRSHLGFDGEPLLQRLVVLTGGSWAHLAVYAANLCNSLQARKGEYVSPPSESRPAQLWPVLSLGKKRRRFIFGKRKKREAAKWAYCSMTRRLELAFVSTP